jgi:hypothetical protein
MQFLDDARQLQWGFVAYPPLTAFCSRVAIGLFGISPQVFRLPAAMVNAISLVLAGLPPGDFGVPSSEGFVGGGVGRVAGVWVSWVRAGWVRVRAGAKAKAQCGGLSTRPIRLACGSLRGLVEMTAVYGWAKAKGNDKENDGRSD